MKDSSPKRAGWTCELLDARDVWQEKEYVHYTHLTPAERIALGESLRRMIYGTERINARLQRVSELIERETR